MRYRLIYADRYEKRARSFIRRHPDMRSRYIKTLQLLELDPFHPSLRLHSLSGHMDGLYSVSINMAYRIVIEFEIRDEEIILVNVGHHEEVY